MTQRAMLRLALILGVLAVSCKPAFAAETVRCQSGDAPEKIAKLVMPANSELAFRPLQLALPSSPHSVVVLYRFTNTQEGDSNYHGWVLAPMAGEPCAYAKYPISEMQEVAGFFEIRVNDVFAAPVGGRNALVILHAYKRHGCFDDSGDAAYVYDWNGSEFTLRSELSEELSGIQTASGVRQAIKDIAVDGVR